MTAAKIKLALAAVAFAAWIGFLGYLAFTTRHPIVLSRPQFLVSNFDVVAEVDNREGGAATVRQVHWPEGQRNLDGRVIHIDNLTECQGWEGPGEYVLALVAQGKDYRVAAGPPSPGSGGQGPRIYRAVPDTLRQLRDIPKAAP